MHTIEYYIEKYGAPLLRKEITGITKKERLNADVPDEVAVFKIDHPTDVMVVGKLANGRWVANFGERTVINLLLKERQ